MSSATSTESVRLKPDTTRTVKPDTTGTTKSDATRPVKPDGSGASTKPGGVRSDDRDHDADSGLQPWQFFVLAALGCATAVTFVARGQGPTAIILLSLLMGTAGLVGYATLRMVRPLVSPDEDRTVMIGERTRVALEREKLLTLRSIKELEFDRAMGRLSESDFHEMASRLRARAATLIRQLDAGVGYRDQIEKDLAKRLGPDADARPKPSRDEEDAERRAAASAERVCAACETTNDHDARFCKGCGQPLGGR